MGVPTLRMLLHPKVFGARYAYMLLILFASTFAPVLHEGKLHTQQNVNSEMTVADFCRFGVSRPALWRCHFLNFCRVCRAGDASSTDDDRR